MSSAKFEQTWKRLQTHIGTLQGESQATLSPSRLRRAKKACEAMVKQLDALLATAEELGLEEEAYLRKVDAAPHGLTDWHQGWGQDKPVRDRLVARKLLKVSFNKACGGMDVDAHTCKLTGKGLAWLREHPRSFFKQCLMSGT